MLVLDASAAVELILRTDVGDEVLRHLDSTHTLHAPELLGLEVVSVLRRLLHAREISESDADDALQLLRSLGIEWYEHEPFLARCLELRHHLSAYDAAYVALAEALDAPLLTGDRKLASSHGHRAEVLHVRARKA